MELPLVTTPNGKKLYSFNLMGRTEYVNWAATGLVKLIQQSELEFDTIVTTAAKSIALTHVVAHRLGIKRHVVLLKDEKAYAPSVIKVSVKSITTEATQKLYLDKDSAEFLRGKRVLFIDDVLSTGGTLNAVLAIARKAGFTITAAAVVLTEGKCRQQFQGVPVLKIDHIPLPGHSKFQPK
jgi:adenine phosphoribosyltransferase